jgi:hypothetical protein
MRRSALIVVMMLAAIGTAVAATRALHRAASNLVGTKLGDYDAIFVIGRDGTGLSQLTHDQRFHGYEWSPDGRWIASFTRSVDAHGFDVAGPLELVEPSATTVQDVRLGGFGSDVVWRSNTSIKLLVTRTVSKLVATRLLDVGPHGAVRHGAWIGPIGGAAWAPRGGALAIVPCGRVRAHFGVEVLSASGRVLRHLGPLPGALAAGVCDDPLAGAGEDVAWAPDGRSLFINLSTGLWRLPLEGAAPRRLDRERFGSMGAVSPDGRQIVVEASPTGARAGNPCCLLYVLPAAGDARDCSLQTSPSNPHGRRTDSSSRSWAARATRSKPFGATAAPPPGSRGSRTRRSPPSPGRPQESSWPSPPAPSHPKTDSVICLRSLPSAEPARCRIGRHITERDGRCLGERAVSHRAGDERFVNGAVVRASMALTPALDEPRAGRPNAGTCPLALGEAEPLASGRPGASWSSL